MPKFVLIDHSIVGIGGHHHEYAAHVLRAAQRAGYKPVLATNRRFKGKNISQLPWEIYAIYKYGFWFRLAKPRWYRALKRVCSSARRSLFRLKCALLFSPLGFAWSVRDQVGTYLHQQTLARSQAVSLAFLLPFAHALNILGSTKNLLKAAVPFPSYWRGLLQQGRRFLESVLSPALLFVRPREWMLRWVFDRRRLKAFAKDTQRLFHKVGLAKGDIIFMPTISTVEMVGLLSFFHRHPLAAQATWHLLFRRNIYNGRETDYGTQDKDVKPIRQAFQQLHEQLQQLRELKVYFHTDTEELKAQYNRLGIFPFHTLPIPHTHPPEEPIYAKAPLRVIYVGDARREKGYHLLPNIVQDLWTDYVQTGKVIFVLQSNYNIPKGEPEAVIARSQLENFPQDKVVLIKTPLSSEGYRDLILSGDINLMLYDRSNYYARSSGILAESLAVGVPVLVPAGTWMARQFLEEFYRYQESLRSQMQTIKTYSVKDLQWHRHGGTGDNPMVQGKLIATKSIMAGCWLEVPRSARYLLLTLRFDRSPLEALIYVDQYDGQQQLLWSDPGRLIEAVRTTAQAIALLPLDKEVRKIRLGISSTHLLSTVFIAEVQVDFLAPHDLQQDYPLGAVGLAYHEEEEISALLREMIDYYPHYRSTAHQFAQRWYQQHNADRLVAELTNYSQAVGVHRVEVEPAPEFQPARIEQE